MFSLISLGLLACLEPLDEITALEPGFQLPIADSPGDYFDTSTHCSDHFEKIYKIRNKWTANYLTESSGNSITPSGVIDYSPSLWTVEASPSLDFVLIRNLASIAKYLKDNLNGFVTGNHLVSSWSSMCWKLILSPTSGYYWIKNK